MDINTICVHGSVRRFDETGAVAVPIFLSATYSHPSVGESTGFDYSRSLNPTRSNLEETVAALENGADAIAFSSGMAACNALMELFSAGDHIIASDDLYGGTYRMFSQINQKNGIKFSYVSCIEEIKNALTPATKAIFIETPTNPMMRVIDIAEVAKIAQKNGVLLIVDNTFLTPYLQRPLLLGADIVLHSATKYLGGHNDVLAGLLVVKDNILGERLRFIAKTTGACLSPFDSYLVIRGIKTLGVRMERAQESAQIIVKWLNAQKKVAEVHYCGAGGMISFSLTDEETAKKILAGVKIIKYAESLGGVESLITYPTLQTHADVPENERNERGINARLLRLSVGIESVKDLISDLEQAMR